MKRLRAVREFIRLFPASTNRALYLALFYAVILSFMDFGAMVLLYPVFGNLATGGAAATGTGFKYFSGVDPKALVILAMALMVLRSISGFAFRYWWTGIVAGAEVSLSSALLSRYAYAPYAFHLRRNSADLLSRSVAHVNMASNAGLNGIVLLASDAAMVAALSAALLFVDPRAALAVMGYLALVAFGFISLSRRFTATQSKRYADQVGQVYRRASTVLQGIRELTVAGARDSALRSIEDSRRSMVRAQRNMTILSEVPRLVLESALYLAILGGLLVVLGTSASKNALAVVALYVVVGLRILPAISRALGNLTLVRTGMQMGEKVGSEMGEITAQGVQGHREAGDLSKQAELELRGVSFGYEDGDKVLRSIDARIPFGESVGLVGPSGAGKSTLLGIILGLLSPDTGSVTYGGRDVGLADARWLRHVGYVPQDVFLLDDSVLANIALGDVSPSEDRAWLALEQALMGDVVRAFPDGLETRLGEGGSRLSVGQRQRLGLARAMYREPSVLVLDEPTAALDRDTEEHVLQAIERLKGRVTILTVAHRLMTLRQCDRIFELNDGFLREVNPSEIFEDG
jgi:ATP-binding cassette, subfamily B, bacterial PglK